MENGHQVSSELAVQYAGFWKRGAALIIDLLLFIVPSVLVNMMAFEVIKLFAAGGQDWTLLSYFKSEPRLSYWVIPHPSGIAFDSNERIIHVASTRNPNVFRSSSPMNSSSILSSGQLTTVTLTSDDVSPPVLFPPNATGPLPPATKPSPAGNAGVQPRLLALQ